MYLETMSCLSQTFGPNRPPTGGWCQLKKASSFTEILRKFCQNFTDFHNFPQISDYFYWFYKTWWNSEKNRHKNDEFWQEFAKIPSNFAKITKNVDEIFWNFWVWSGAKDCYSCRSRKMLQNEYLDAKIGFDTEENELSKVCRSKQAIPHPGHKSGSDHVKPRACLPLDLDADPHLLRNKLRTPRETWMMTKEWSG